LVDAVRAEAERHTGSRPEGPVRVLTHLRYFGYVMNPVTFYYCFAPDGKHVETILAEITNTPWNERHTYALGPAPEDDTPAGHPHRFAKAFHISPFLDMDHTYEWRFSAPEDRLNVHMENMSGGEKTLDVTLDLEREEITNLRNQCSKLEDIVTAQRIVILQLTENEDRLHQLLDIERRKTLSAELALQGEALTDIATSEPEGNPF